MGLAALPAFGGMESERLEGICFPEKNPDIYSWRHH